MIQKWVTWVISTKDLESKTTEEVNKLDAVLVGEVKNTISDIYAGLPVSFKITNLSRRDERES